MNNAEPLVDPRLARLLAGESLEFPAPPKGREETTIEAEARSIPASWLEQLAAGHKRTVSAPIRVSHAIIAGALDFQYATFEYGVSITDCTFTEQVDFSFSSFKRSAVFRTTFFGEANFRSARFQGDAKFSGAEFRESADFDRLEVNGDTFFDTDDSRNIRTTFFQEASFRFSHFQGNALFSGAEFRAAADFESMQVNGDAFFDPDDSHGMRTTFFEKASFLAAHFQGTAQFNGAEFRAMADFEGIEVNGDAFFKTDKKHSLRTTFGGETSFHFAHIQGNAEFSGAEFRDKADFKRLQVNGSAQFVVDGKNNRTTFSKDADFNYSHFRFNAQFQGAEFKSESTFQSMRVDGFSFFRTDKDGNRTTFGGDANFFDAHVGGDAEFQGSVFKSKATFRRFQVEGSILFRTDDHRNRTTFAREFSLVEAHIKGFADFNGADFQATASFTNMKVDGDAHFHRDKLIDAKLPRNPVTFGGDASFLSCIFGTDGLFSGAIFKAGATFNESQFQGVADFEGVDFAANSKATFIRTRFRSGGDFTLVRFNGETDYTGAVAERDLDFSGAIVNGPIRFNEAKLQAAFFGKPIQRASQTWRWHWSEESGLKNQTVVCGPVDLLGLTYERLYIDLTKTKLFKQLEPFNRQPYSQFEDSLRQAGEDKHADQVYLERRKVERGKKLQPRTIHMWIIDWLYKLTANYGVRPLRLIVYALLIVWFGAAIFSRPGALEPKEKSQGLDASAAVPAGKGLDVSIHYFLPMDSPIGSDWIPVSRAIPVPIQKGVRANNVPVRPDWYGTFLRITGTALMGLGLAAVSGLLRRIAN
jgi:hypothetical protein